jgi:glycosyltransferase involved in cell wall biosynthesis
VLFVAPSAYVLSGLAVWLDYLLPGLRSNGWQPVLGLTNGKYHCVQDYLSVHSFPDVEVFACPTGTREGRLRSLVRTIDMVDPVIVVSVNIPDALWAVTRLRKRDSGRDIRAVISVHGLEPCIFGDALSLVGSLDGFISSNRLGAGLAEAVLGLPSDRVQYVPYGVGLPAGHLRKADSTPLQVAFVGRFERGQKRIQDLRAIVEKTLQKNRNVRFTLAGDGEELPGLLEWRMANGWEEQVAILRDLTPEQVQQQVYPGSDVLLVTSFWETGPLVIWEAMAHGVAVVSSKYIGAGLESALVHGENALLFEIANIDDAVSHILSLTDATHRDAIVANGRQLVEQRYSHGASVTAWDQALRTVLAAEPLADGPPLPPLQPAGRLDRLFGISAAESIRQFLGLGFEHQDAGGEWPHCYGHRSIERTRFWKAAVELDRLRNDESAFRDAEECATIEQILLQPHA